MMALEIGVEPGLHGRTYRRSTPPNCATIDAVPLAGPRGGTWLSPRSAMWLSLPSDTDVVAARGGTQTSFYRTELASSLVTTIRVLALITGAEIF